MHPRAGQMLAGGRVEFDCDLDWWTGRPGRAARVIAVEGEAHSRMGFPFGIPACRQTMWVGADTLMVTADKLWGAAQ